MSSLNKVLLIGRAGKDAEVRQTQNGQSVANFSLATSEQWKDAQGERQERTEWHSLVAWGPLAEVCGQYVHKGTQLYAEGRLQTREYDDRDGNRRRVTEIVLSELRLLGGRSDDASEGSAPQGGRARKSESTRGAKAKPGPRSASAPPSAPPAPPPSADEDDIPF